MTDASFVSWALPAAITALSIIVLAIGQRLLAKIDGLERLMKAETRLMDVRLSVIEHHLWPDRPLRHAAAAHEDQA